MLATLRFGVRELKPYINWLYFYHAWGVKGEGQKDLRHEAEELLDDWSRSGVNVLFRFRLLKANANDDSIYFVDNKCANIDSINETVNTPFPPIPLLRQQKKPYLCLSDFLPPIGLKPATIGVFVSTMPFMADDLLSLTLADRLAEAAAEKGHEHARKFFWKYAQEEDLTPMELFSERYIGKRPAIGYPSLPDHSVNFILSTILDFSSLGISLTENAAMIPHSTTSGLMISHPECRHFSVGTIGEDQLLDYSKRRGIDSLILRKYLDISS